MVERVQFRTSQQPGLEEVKMSRNVRFPYLYTNLGKVDTTMPPLARVRHYLANGCCDCLQSTKELVQTDISQQCLSLIASWDICRCFVTVDETWIHHYTPESRQQLKQWTGLGERVPKKANIYVSRKSDEYYATLLDQLKEELCAKHLRLVRKKVLFHHNNTLFHKLIIAAAKLFKLGNFHPMKRLSTMQMNSLRTSKHHTVPRGLKKSENHWTRCVGLNGDYVEK
ncbi:hypothetical protein LAZ67_6003508 [Cordylochernes scorpioides]|uniref:Transposase n=1 Tax=Cordylochernes scorpioides TaxID=51811 RepID=A0ABY6KKM8_9ARAC|nr:hypothetical protein LAZ67_6003508 [Cordylochernes scorpioides]